MTILYNILFLIFAIVYLPYAALKGKLHRGFVTRCGFLPREIRRLLAGQRNLWIHAVSVGEVAAIEPFVRRLLKVFPGHQIVVTTVTRTGYALAQARLGDTCLILFAPLDFSFTVREYIRRIKPRLYIAAETEIWPNLFHVLHAKKIPILQINGRISDGAFVRYRRVRFLLKYILRKAVLFGMQTEEDARRLIDLGALPDTVRVTGNLKFDMGTLPAAAARTDGGPLWLAGSTHPGEEELVLKAYRQLKEEFPSLRLVIAPRHVERAVQVEDIIQRNGLESKMHSACAGAPGQRDVVTVVDTIGQLRGLYALADVVFMGKSLTAHGGQNMIEPAFCGKAVIVGPYTENFRDVVDRLAVRDAIVRVPSGEELAQAAGQLLRDPQERERIGREARQTVLDLQGATEKSLAMVQEVLGEERG